MTDAPLYSAYFHSDTRKEWENDELLYVPRSGDRFLEDGQAFVVEEVWEVGESLGHVPFGTHVFVKEIPLEGSKLHVLAKERYVRQDSRS